MDYHYDVVIVGAGPAGGQCARELAKVGIKVLIVDRQNEIGEPNFSTAGTTSDIIKEFKLPDELVPYKWDKLYLASPNVELCKELDHNFGYVFDFRKLRQWLVEVTAKLGGEVMVATNVKDFLYEDGKIVGVKYVGPMGDGEIRAKIVVDATGSIGTLVNKLKMANEVKKDVATGIEYQMTNVKFPYKNTLYFYLGDKFIPNGYGWVFPLSNHMAKVGIGRRLFGGSKEEKKSQNLNEMLTNFIHSIPWLESSEPVEFHAGTLTYNPEMKNFVQDNFMVIGTAASHVNPLGGEGIRHGMYSGRFAARVIIESLESNDCSKQSLIKYNKLWRDYSKNNWSDSYLLARSVYDNTNDIRMDAYIKRIDSLNGDEIYDTLFNYKFKRNALKMVSRIGLNFFKKKVG